jgi:GntR family transcriptional regulator
MVDWGGNYRRIPSATPSGGDEWLDEEDEEDEGRGTGEPEYQEIAEDLKERISTDEWPSGPLPSVRQLQQEYDVSRGTVLRAIKLLKDQDLVFTLPRRGIYIKRETDRG